MDEMRKDFSFVFSISRLSDLFLAAKFVVFFTPNAFIHPLPLHDTLDNLPSEKLEDPTNRHITTARLVLRPLVDGDAQGLFALQTNPQVTRYQSGRQGYTLQDAIDFIPFVNGGIRANRWHFWVIALHDAPNVLIGNISLWNMAPGEHLAELGFELHPDYHGQGIMSEAATAVMQHAAAHLDIIRFEAYTREQNKAAIALLRKLGFAFDGVDDEKYPYEKNEEVVMYRY